MTIPVRLFFFLASTQGKAGSFSFPLLLLCFRAINPRRMVEGPGVRLSFFPLLLGRAAIGLTFRENNG